nr:hypothetical protein [Nakamurella sp. PAMC28650]
MQLLMAPTVNSYKRTGAVATTSGATWSPRFATYGGNDRTHYIRVPDDQRIEIRGGDGSANPYLAIAGVLGAGSGGIERALDPGPPGAGEPGTRRPLPRTLVDAVGEFESSETISGVMDCAGKGVAEYFASLKRDEFYAWHSAIGSWEIDKYLQAF